MNKVCESLNIDLIETAKNKRGVLVCDSKIFTSICLIYSTGKNIGLKNIMKIAKALKTSNIITRFHLRHKELTIIHDPQMQMIKLEMKE